MNHALLLVIVFDAGLEVIIILVSSMNLSAKVVTSIDDITHEGECFNVTARFTWLTAYNHFGMAQDIGITGSTKGIIDTAVTQVDV